MNQHACDGDPMMPRSGLAIWKFPAPIKNSFTIEMPQRAEILALQVQFQFANESPYLWALCDASAQCPKVTRTFYYVGTGHDHPASFWTWLTYIGTVQLNAGATVFHLFEETR